MSSDKDLMQLVGETVRFYDFESGQRASPATGPSASLDRAAIMERWEGLAPEQIGDALALIGDTSDNVPGVPGIGLKTAAALIKEFGSLDALLERAGEIKQPKRRETLLGHIDQARLSRRLVTLDEAVPVPVPLDALGLPKPDPEKTRRLPQGDGVQHADAPDRVAAPRRPRGGAADPALLPGGADPGYSNPQGGSDVTPFFGDAPDAAPPAEVDPFADLDLPDAPPPPRSPRGVARHAGGRPRPPRRSSRSTTGAYETVTSLERLDAWIAEAVEAGVVAVDTETNALDALKADLVGVSLATAAGRAAYIPLDHVEPVEAKGDGDLFAARRRPASSGASPTSFPGPAVRERLKPMLENPAVLKVGRTSSTTGWFSPATASRWRRSTTRC